MDEAISWGISLIAVFIVWLVWRSHSKRRTGDGTGGDAGRIRSDIAGAADDNQRLRESEQRTAEAIRDAEEQNQRAQHLVRKAKDILGSATHCDGDK